MTRPLESVPLMLVTAAIPAVELVARALEQAGARVERVHPRDHWRWWFFERRPRALLVVLNHESPDYAETVALLTASDLRVHAPVLALCMQATAVQLSGVSRCLTAPFRPDRVVSLVRDLVAGMTTEMSATYGNLTLDHDGHTVWVDGRPAALTPTEYLLLAMLMAQPGRVLTRERLRAELWPDGGAPTGRALDVHLTRLRGKLAGARGLRIATVRGVGYRLLYDPAA